MVQTLGYADPDTPSSTLHVHSCLYLPEYMLGLWGTSRLGPWDAGLVGCLGACQWCVADPIPTYVPPWDSLHSPSYSPGH